ncbi:MAG: EAL domain-containing protein [Azoarcus sp.]|nr:EAL domain-containing protein [Azoarcus sp.]
MTLFSSIRIFVLISALFGLTASPAQANDAIPDTQPSLSTADRQWLQAHPVIRIGIDPNYAPYSFLGESGRVQGVVAEYLAHIENTLGIRFEIRADLDWPQLMEAVRDHRLDAVATVVRLPERESFMTFSRIFLNTPLVIMTRTDWPQLSSLDELATMRLALVSGYSGSSQANEEIPDLRPIYVPTPLDGLRAVSSGMADAYIGVLGVNTFLATQSGITNLKVNAAFNMKDNGQRFGIRKDWPELALIIDKALDKLPETTQREILAKWLPIQAEDIRLVGPPGLASRLFPWLVVFSIAVALGYFAILLWNRQLRAELQHRKLELERALGIAGMGDWSLDIASGRIRWADELFRIAGRPPTALDWPTLREWIHPDDRDKHDEYLSQLRATAPGAKLPTFVSHLVRPDGDSRWLEVSSATDFDAAGKPLRHYGTALDITERKLAEDRIRNLAYFDSLTGLPNRRLLMDRLSQALSASKRSGEYGALIMLDLDRFKDLNDTQGHDVGDLLLIEVARRLTAHVRHEDTVSRLGGDEYIVVAEALGADESSAALEAGLIAEQCRRGLGEAFSLACADTSFHGTTSIGITLFKGNDLTLDVLFKQADVALYQAKKAGRNTVRFFNSDMQSAIDSRIKMESALRRGLHDDEFRLHFQPLVDHGGQRIGAEALLRWFPHGADPVSPAHFIPLAEDTGLILPIGDWVLKKACEQLKRWGSDARTQDLTISVNVSARQFHQPNFVEQVIEEVRQAGVSPSRLKLELTESVVLERVDEVVARMQRLKSEGITFSLDDFGTGYSSLSYLKRLPLDQIKIDQSFIRDIISDRNDAAIVRAILAIGQSLGITVIAEGVETEAQRDLLLEYGCVYFQGYLFGRPVPMEHW